MPLGIPDSCEPRQDGEEPNNERGRLYADVILDLEERLSTLVGHRSYLFVAHLLRWELEPLLYGTPRFTRSIDVPSTEDLWKEATDEALFIANPMEPVPYIPPAPWSRLTADGRRASDDPPYDGIRFRAPRQLRSPPRELVEARLMNIARFYNLDQPSLDTDWSGIYLNLPDRLRMTSAHPLFQPTRRPLWPPPRSVVRDYEWARTRWNRVLRGLGPERPEDRIRGVGLP